MRLPRPLNAAGLLLGAAAAAGCGADELPRLGQIVLFVDTDAPLPPPAGQPLDPGEPAALFDTVRVDVSSPDHDCAQCRHEFAVDRERIGAGASLGILPDPGATGYVARVRLFRVALLDQGEPRSDSTVDVTVALPAVADGELAEVTAFLPTETVGVPLGSDAAPIPPEPRRPGQPRVGTWPGARRVQCTAAVGFLEACIPGGAYWMGNPGVTAFQKSQPADRQRLVVLKPFIVDTTEVTVGSFRASGLREEIGGPVLTTLHGGATESDWCTYTPTPKHDELPVNCLTWGKAREYCLSLGKDLMTEAQYEYAAGALRSWDFVWGRDFPSCTDAVFGRTGYGIFSNSAAQCMPPEPIGGPLSPGSGPWDALPLETGTVVDLAGNMTELTLDVFNTQDEPCWGAGVRHDPVCTQPGVWKASHTVRGGHWGGFAGQMMAARRVFQDDSWTTATIGFRCARPGG